MDPIKKYHIDDVVYGTHTLLAMIEALDHSTLTKEAYQELYDLVTEIGFHVGDIGYEDEPFLCPLYEERKQ